MKAHRYQALQVQLDQNLPATICSTRCLHLYLLPAMCLKTGTRFFKLHLSKLHRGHCKFKARIQSYGLALPMPEVWWGLRSGSLQSDLSSEEYLKMLSAEMEIPLLALCFGTLQVPCSSPTSPLEGGNKKLHTQTLSNAVAAIAAAAQALAAFQYEQVTPVSTHQPSTALGCFCL